MTRKRSLPRLVATQSRWGSWIKHSAVIAIKTIRYAALQGTSGRMRSLTLGEISAVSVVVTRVQDTVAGLV